MDCNETDELAGAYALNALPPERLLELEEHLATCSAHPQLAEFRIVAASLVWAAEEMDPPTGLKDRIMEAVRPASAQASEPAPSSSAYGGLLGRWWRNPVQRFGLAGAALAVLVIGLLGWNVALQASSDGDDNTVVATLRNGEANGRLVYIKDEELAVLTIRGLPRLPVSQTYQVWAITSGAPTSLGLLNTSEIGDAAVILKADLSDADIAAITVEPAGGSPQPTTPPLLQTKL